MILLSECFVTIHSSFCSLIPVEPSSETCGGKYTTTSWVILTLSKTGKCAAFTHTDQLHLAKEKILKYFLLGLIFTSNLAFAGAGSGKITVIYAHERNNGEGVILFGVEDNREKASCSTAASGKEWAFRANTDHGKAMYALLLAAASSGKEITVVGNDACGAWGDREEPSYVRVIY